MNWETHKKIVKFELKTIVKLIQNKFQTATQNIMHTWPKIFINLYETELLSTTEVCCVQTRKMVMLKKTKHHLSVFCLTRNERK